MSRRRAISAALIAGVAFAACSDDGAAPSSSTSTATTTGTAAAPATSAAAASTAPAATVPVSTVVERVEVRAVLDEVLGWLADPTTIDVERFNDEFRAVVPDAQIVAAIESLGRGPWQASNVQLRGLYMLEATLTGPVMRGQAQLALDADGRISGLGFAPDGLTDPPETLADLTAALGDAAPSSGFMRAEIGESGECVPVAALNADQPLALGSAFKLYVLGAVAAAIDAGELTWDQAVEIRDELDSLPSGSTQDEPAGSTLSVRELAQRMIEVSDNTATDHLIDLVGRDAVENALSDLGHHDPTITQPFTTTRELFIIKADPDLRERYAAADEAGRRAVLAGEVADAVLPPPDPWIEPWAVTTIEWFASPADVCRALVGLDALADRPGLEPVAEVLSRNTGLPEELPEFSVIYFKGGSEPGVLFTAWLATRPDGTRVAVTGGATDETAEIAPYVILLLVEGLSLDQ